MANPLKEDVKKRAIKETFHWIVLSSVFGLLQLVIIIVFAILLPNKELKFDELLKDGLLLFFSVSLVTSSIVDYHLDEVKSTSKIVGSIIAFTPILFCLISSCVYAVIYFQKDEVLSNELGIIELVLLLGSFIFSFLIKYHANCYKLSI